MSKTNELKELIKLLAKSKSPKAFTESLLQKIKDNKGIISLDCTVDELSLADLLKKIKPSSVKLVKIISKTKDKSLQLGVDIHFHDGFLCITYVYDNLEDFLDKVLNALEKSAFKERTYLGDVRILSRQAAIKPPSQAIIAHIGRTFQNTGFFQNCCGCGVNSYPLR